MKYFNQKCLSDFSYKFGIFLCSIIFSGLAFGNASAQSLLVNYDFASAVLGTPCTATPLTTTAGVTSTFTTGGTGGETYVLSVSSKNHTFENPTRVISLSDNVANADFVSVEP